MRTFSRMLKCYQTGARNTCQNHRDLRIALQESHRVEERETALSAVAQLPTKQLHRQACKERGGPSTLPQLKTRRRRTFRRQKSHKLRAKCEWLGGHRTSWLQMGGLPNASMREIGVAGRALYPARQHSNLPNASDNHLPLVAHRLFKRCYSEARTPCLLSTPEAAPTLPSPPAAKRAAAVRYSPKAARRP